MANDPVVDLKALRAVDAAGNVHNLVCDANGNLITSGGGTGTSTVKVADGTTPTQLLAVDASGRITVIQGPAGAAAWLAKGAGTAGTADAGVLTVQGIASMTPLQVADGFGSSLWTVGNQSPADGYNGAHALGMGGLRYNEVSWDRERGNTDNISLLASAARTTTQTTADQTNYNARGIIVTLDVTVAGTGSITLEIDYKDPVSGKYIALLTGAAVTTVSTNQYTVYPGATVTANVSASVPLPRTWRVKVTANNANAMTYSVGAALIN